MANSNSNLTAEESVAIDGLGELVITRHRRLLARPAEATRRGRHPGPVPPLDDVLAGVRADLGKDYCATVMGELRDRLRRRLAEPDPVLPAGADEPIWVQ